MAYLLLVCLKRVAHSLKHDFPFCVQNHHLLLFDIELPLQTFACLMNPGKFNQDSINIIYINMFGAHRNTDCSCCKSDHVTDHEKSLESVDSLTSADL